MARAAERNGVRRFIPSDFSIDYRKLDFGDNDNLDMRSSQRCPAGSGGSNFISATRGSVQSKERQARADEVFGFSRRPSAMD
ncbi:MAG TPA: hypothetical protein VES20_04125 [Bryobacteraceae bacterium]|nr:hypothetical protein [Bryobacteraceae bacterium]